MTSHNSNLQDAWCVPAEFRDMKPTFLGIDAGGTNARRIIEKPNAEEKDQS
jgi:hypothetical protein